MKINNLTLRIFFVVIAFLSIILFFIFRQSNVIASWVCYIISFLTLMINLGLNIPIKKLRFLSIAAQVIIFIFFIISIFMIIKFDSSHLGMHQMEKYFLFFTISATVIMVLSFVYSLICVIKAITNNKVTEI